MTTPQSTVRPVVQSHPWTQGVAALTPVSSVQAMKAQAGRMEAHRIKCLELPTPVVGAKMSQRNKNDGEASKQ